MEATRKSEHTSNEPFVCNGEFCQALAGFSPDINGETSDIVEAFRNYLSTHYPKQPALTVGTKAEVEARQVSCSFCRFTCSRIAACGLSHEDGDLECVAFWMDKYEGIGLGLRRTEVDFVGNLQTVGERVAFVGGSETPDYRSHKVVGVEELDYARVRHWLELCDELHKDTCPIPTGIQGQRRVSSRTLRVVDLENECLTEIPWQEKYVALSYVWGKASPPKLFADELEKLSRPHALRGIKQSMPQTHQDVWHLATMIGLRYFWFDSLCLIQDSPVDLKTGIAMMDVIYEGAYLTIVAAEGAGADRGLPGVSSTPRGLNQQVATIKPGLTTKFVRTLDRHLKDSVWNTRGWTLQEHYLSRRTISFVNGQAYFRCRQRVWSEEDWSDVNPSYGRFAEEQVTSLDFDAVAMLQPKANRIGTWTYIATVMEEYSGRNLTSDTDSINAMTGFLNRVISLEGSHSLEGMPIYTLPLMLLFRHHRTRQRSTVRRRSDFSSWAWGGWEGLIYCYAVKFMGRRCLEWLATRNWIVFFQSTNGNPPELVWKSDKVSPPFMDDTSKAVYSPATHPAKFEQLGLSTHVTTPVSVSPPVPKTVLGFHTVMISLTVRSAGYSTPMWNGAYMAQSLLYDKDDKLCGYVLQDIDLPETPGSRHDIILLAEGMPERMYVANFDDETVAELNKLVDTNVSKVYNPSYWVLLVVQVDDGLYERRAAGQLVHTALENSFSPGPRWTEIALA